MKNPTYIQIDSSILGDSKVAVLLRKHGAIGLAIYLYLLIQANHSPSDGLCIDEGFKDCAAIMLNLSFEDLDNVLDTIIKLGLLYDDNGLYYSNGYMKRTGQYKEANKKRSETQKQNSIEKANQPQMDKLLTKLAQDIVKNPAKTPKKEPVPDSPDTDEITAVRDEITAMLQHAENTTGVKPGNKKSTLSNREIETLIEKFGLSTLLVMVDVFYLWKLTSKRIVSSDYLSMLQSWVQERAEKQINGNGNCKQQIKQQSSEDFSMYRL